MEFSIDILFKLLNFGFTIGVGWYLVRHYGILAIVQAMRIEKEDLVKLEGERNSLHKESKKITQSIEDQEQQFYELQKKFKSWQGIVAENEEAINQVMDQRKKESIKNRQAILISLQEQKMMQKELPILLQDVVSDLQKKMNDQKDQKEYIDKIISRIGE